MFDRNAVSACANRNGEERHTLASLASMEGVRSAGAAVIVRWRVCNCGAEGVFVAAKNGGMAQPNGENLIL